MKTMRWLVVCLVAVSFSGCFMFKNATPQEPQTKTNTIDEDEWICRGSGDNGDWNCTKVNDESGETINIDRQIATIDAKQEQVAAASTRPSLERVPVKVRRYEPPGSTAYSDSSGVVTEDASFATSNTDLSQSNTNITAAPIQRVGAVQASEDVPDYRFLAYVPATPTKLVNLPSHFFAVQLGAFADREKVEEFARSTQLKDLVGSRISSSGKKYYVLLLGIYETRSRAERAARSVQDQIGAREPWIRSMKSLQTAIRDADRQFGLE